MATSCARIAAVVLAAGMSRRMGSAKALLPLGDRTMIQHVIDSLIASDAVAPIVVVTGHEAEQLRSILHGRRVVPVHNPDYAAGEMLSSVQAGLRAVRGKCDAAMIVLGDQPGVRAETVATLASAWRGRRPRVLRPVYRGKRGHPILIAASASDEILSLTRDQTLKDFTSQHLSSTIEVEVQDPAILRDIDTPDDYAEAMQQHSARSPRNSAPLQLHPGQNPTNPISATPPKLPSGAR